MRTFYTNSRPPSPGRRHGLQPAVIAVGRLEAEPAVEPHGGNVVLLDLKVELVDSLVGSPTGRVLEHGGGLASPDPL